MTHKPNLLAFSLSTLFALSTFTITHAQPAPAREPRDPRDPAAQPQEKQADLMGRVTTVSPDGQSLTLTMIPRRPEPGQPPARDTKPEQASVTVTGQTQLLFFGVAEGEARPTVGQMAMVWLAPGSKDQAARIRLMKREGEERPDVQGRIVSVAADGRTITVETHDRDQPPAKVDLHLAPHTQSLYYGVDKDGARPTPDYQVVAWLEKGSKDTPARIRFMKADPRDAGAQRP